MYSEVKILKEIRRQLRKAQSWVDACPSTVEDEWKEALEAYTEASQELVGLITEALEGA